MISLHRSDGCWFENCGVGIRTVVGRDANMYVRNCDFRYSTSADILLDAQANSVKRCVSIGSASFISMSTVGGPYNGSTTGDPRDWGHTTGTGGAPFGPATVAGNTVVPAPGNINVNLGVFTRRFSTVSDRFSGSWRPFPESCGKDGANGEKTGKKRAKLGEKWPKKSGGKFCLLYTSPSPRDRG